MNSFTHTSLLIPSAYHFQSSLSVSSLMHISCSCSLQQAKNGTDDLHSFICTVYKTCINRIIPSAAAYFFMTERKEQCLNLLHSFFPLHCFHLLSDGEIQSEMHLDSNLFSIERAVAFSFSSFSCFQVLSSERGFDSSFWYVSLIFNKKMRIKLDLLFHSNIYIAHSGNFLTRKGITHI